MIGYLQSDFGTVSILLFTFMGRLEVRIFLALALEAAVADFGLLDLVALFFFAGVKSYGSIDSSFNFGIYNKSNEIDHTKVYA